MAKVYLGLGSNIEPERHLRMGIAELRERFGKIELSATYQNRAVGFDGADFLNLVTGLESAASPAEVQSEIERIHRLAGRHRGEARYSSRPLDIDLLLYDDLVMDKPGLRLPRPDILEYSFVLRPLSEIAPNLLHPVTGKSIAAHWQEYDKDRHPLTAISVIL